MSSSGKKWLTGCGIAFVIGILVIAALIYGGIRLGKKAIEEVEKVQAASQALNDRFGEPSSFAPDADGGIRPERLEAFLGARAGMATFRREMEQSLAVLDGADSSDGKSAGLLSKGREGLKLLPRIFGFYRERSQACLEAEIGLGEYTYIYVLGYYGFLQKQMAAGPGFTLVSSGDDHSDTSRSMDDFAVREARREMILSTARDLFLDILQNQLDASQAAGRPDSEEWETRLQAEIGKLQSDPYRLPWDDGLPEQIVKSLEPYRDRLESYWSEMCNALEVGPQIH